MVHGLSSLGRLQESPLSSHARELNFVAILTKRLGAADGSVARLGRKAFTHGLTGQSLFCVLSPPGNRCHMSQNNASTLYRLAVHLESHGCSRERPIQRFLLPNFISGISHSLGRRNDDFT